MLDYIAMQTRNDNREKGYCVTNKRTEIKWRLKNLVVAMITTPPPAPKKAKFEYQKQKMEIKICASLAFF